MRPALSVIIPCADFDEKARLCLAALQTQLQAGDECLLVLDGAEAAADLDLGSAIRIIHATNRRGRAEARTTNRQGPAVARNRGAAQARGQVLLFVDADVVVHETALERVRGFFERDAGDAVFGCYDDQPADPGFTSQFRNLQHHFVHATNAGVAATFWAGCGAVKSEVFEQAGGFDESYRRPEIEDIELGMRLAKAGCRIVLDPGLQGKHLKRWTLLAMWSNDLMQRALPWSRLILATGGMPKGLNTDWPARVAVAAQGLAWTCLMLAFFKLEMLVVAAVFQVVAGLCHMPFLSFLARVRGPVFALAAVPLMMAYMTISGAGFAWAWAGRRRVTGRDTILAVEVKAEAGPA